MKSLLVTGSSGLIGSEVVALFAARGWKVHGADNNMRADFFGSAGIPDGTWPVWCRSTGNSSITRSTSGTGAR